MYRIYKYTSPEGKSYVGCTTQTLKIRAGICGINYSQCTRFWEAIKKFGWDSMVSEILAETDDAYEAGQLEIANQLKYDTVNPEHGYNSRIQEYPFTPEVRAKLAASVSAAMTPEVKSKISEHVKAALSDPEVHAKLTEANRANLAKPEVKQKLAEANYRRFANPAEVERIKTSLAEYWTEERRHEQGEMLKERMTDPEIRQKISEGTKQGLATPGRRAQRSIETRNRWQDPAFRDKTQAAMKTACNTDAHRAKLSAIGYEVQNRPEMKQLRSEKFKGLVFINNGVTSKRVPESEVADWVATGEWKKGRIKPGKGSRGACAALKGRRWVHKGTERKFVDDAEYAQLIAEGWSSGMGPLSK